MRAFEFRAKGLVFRAVIVVTAERRDKAYRTARKWVAEQGLDPETVELNDEPEKIEDGKIVYSWNGDY
jgi:hypothetical protein